MIRRLAIYSGLFLLGWSVVFVATLIGLGLVLLLSELVTRFLPLVLGGTIAGVVGGVITVAVEASTENRE